MTHLEEENTSDPVVAPSERFHHEKLDVYRVAVDFAVWRHQVKLPKGQADLSDQLSRATTSILLNIAEGSGEFSRPEKQRFYRMARRSAVECAAALDLLQIHEALTQEQLEPGREMLSRVVAMLTKLVPRESR